MSTQTSRNGLRTTDVYWLPTKKRRGLNPARNCSAVARAVPVTKRNAPRWDCLCPKICCEDPRCAWPCNAKRRRSANPWPRQCNR
eukprot:11162890-Lingulodinium_polyedra.AAC.1